MITLSVENEIIETEYKIDNNVLDNCDEYKRDLQRLIAIETLLKNDLVLEIAQNMRITE